MLLNIILYHMDNCQNYYGNVLIYVTLICTFLLVNKSIHKIFLEDRTVYNVNV
jgi:hypothetical protein